MANLRWKIIEHDDGTCTIKRIVKGRHFNGRYVATGLLGYPDIEAAKTAMSTMDQLGADELDPNSTFERYHLFDEHLKPIKNG